MKKKLLLIGLSVLILFGCKKSKNVVNLKVEGIEKGTKILISKKMNGSDTLFSGVIEEDNIIDLSSRKKEEFPDYYFVRFPGKKILGFSLIINSRDNILIKYDSLTNIDMLEIHSDIQRGKENFRNYNDSTKYFNQKIEYNMLEIKKLYVKILEIPKNDIEKRNRIKEEEKEKYNLLKIYTDSLLDVLYPIMMKEEPKNISHIFEYIENFYSSSKNLEIIDKSLEILTKYQNKFKINFISEQISYLENMKDKKISLNIGHDFIELEALGLDRKTIVKLSDVVKNNKVVLIKFWASWCGPCIRSFPETLELTKKYSDRDFKVFAVSLDKEDAENKWKDAIKKYKLENWIHCSELKYTEGINHKKYNVKSIPAEFLIINGKIASLYKVEKNVLDSLIRKAYL